MKEFSYTITATLGIHARPAGLLVAEAKKYSSVVTIISGSKRVAATSMIKLIGMGVRRGDTVKVQIEGDDEETCAAAIENFMKEHM